MYKVIGTDGKEYGPAEAGHLREWIRQGRVEPQTPVFVAGSPEWTFVGLLPEFAQEFPKTSPPVLSNPAPAPLSPPGHSMAKAGLFCGILSITVGCCCCGLPFNLLGLVFSLIALVQISENRSEQLQVSRSRDLAILGLILSLLSLLFAGGLLIFH